MAFPSTPLDLRAELDINDTWTDVSTDVYQREGTSPPVVITRGRPDESASVSPSSAVFDLNNRLGKYSPANPLGTYYPYLNRNTPLRLSVPAQVNYLRLEGDTASGTVCGDSAGVSITGDTEIQLDFWLTNWQPCVLAAKWHTSSDKTWALLLNGDGTLTLTCWDGSTVYTSTSVLPLPVQHRIAVKVTLKLNDGSGNHVVTFYTAPSIAGSWTILGSAVTTAGTISSLYDSTAGVEVGYSYGYTVTDPHAGYNTGMTGRIYEFRLISGIGGTIKANPVYTAQPPGMVAWFDAESNQWLFYNTAEISDRDYRYHGEMSSLPPKWDATAVDVHVPVTAGGLLRRLGQRTAPLNSPVYRYYGTPAAPAVAAWWPMEDGTGATSLGSASGGFPMRFTGSPKLASSTAFPGSAALPVSNSASFTGPVAYGGSWTANDIRFLCQIPSGGEPDSTIAVSITTTGIAALVQLVYTTTTGGSLTMQGTDSSGNPILGSQVITGVNGLLLAVQVTLTVSGGNVIAALNAVQAGGAAVIAGGSAPVTGSLGAVTSVQLNPYGGLVSTVFGHCAVLPAVTTIGALNNYANPDGTVTGPLNGWLGEPAAVRFARLAGEEGFQSRVIGPVNATAPMGYQPAASLTSLLQECEDSDRGQQFEPRACLGLGYRTLASMCVQAVTATIDYSQAQAGGTSTGALLEPVYDDRYICNDATVTRGGGTTTGASYRYQLNDGSVMSVSNPPTGAGDYAGTLTASLEYDSQVPHIASWVVHVATVNEARWPLIPLNLARTAVTSLYYTLAGADIGDYAKISNMLNLITYDPVKQLVLQVKESLGGYFHELEWSCAPESPYEVAVAGTARAESAGTTLHTNYSSGATSLSVDVTGELWATGGTSINILVAGEEMTITNITGSSSPQTFTVTRAVNGVVKAQASGAAVNLYAEPYAALAGTP
jgi:hypothetical protein